MVSNALENKQLFKKIPDADLNQAKFGRTELKAIVWFGCSIFLLICLVSYDPRDPSFNVVTRRSEIHNLCGLIGSHIADALAQLIGVCSFFIPFFFAMTGIKFLSQSSPKHTRLWDSVSFLVLTLILCSLIDRYSSLTILNFSPHNAGGAVGSIVNAGLCKFFGQAGSLVISITIFIICVLELTRGSLIKVLLFCFPSAGTLNLLNFGFRDKLSSLLNLAFAWLRSSLKAALSQRRHQEPAQVIIPQEGSSPLLLEREPLEKEALDVYAWERLSFLPKDEFHRSIDERVSEADTDVSYSSISTSVEDEFVSRQHNPIPWKSIDIKESDLESIPNEKVDFSAALESQQIDDPGYSPDSFEEEKLGEIDDLTQNQVRPIKVTKRADLDLEPIQVEQTFGSTESDYRLPPIDLLDIPEQSKRFVDERLLETNAGILEQKLGDLGIKGQVVEIHPGPVITMYEISLAPGIPLRRVLNTSDDLAMALKSGSTRVVAPIPGKDTVGIEVPNLYREIVYFREIIESSVFKSNVAPLKMALGKCIDGEPFATSLARMPHLLIAGATGTGKSVGLNILICSWLMTYSPDEVKFIMVDPKKLELSYYQDIPHLIYPVVTDPDKVPKVLSWGIREMERRYELLSKAGAKNIESYNQKIQSGVISTPEGEDDPQKLPYIIIIVDELAELMMVAAKDIEISIARLAQMARAAGIHLILATQRPSVDVITGVIKANFPARISFQVSAKPDSRTIIDTVGAEHLLGMGDMLFLPPGTSKLLRLHGAFVSENEIRRIADFTKAQRSPVYLSEISSIVNGSDSGSSSGSEALDDEKYDEAVALVTRIGHASISLIQRHMRIGYNRAARIIETMESQGLIGPSDGTSRPREVLALSLENIPDRD
ncbi:MAG: DNA translocase FtsK [Desulfomonilaceae bacterium]|jgi:S-DNA-T family DNA segregation ATPase FtsK/SpoIIIE